MPKPQRKPEEIEAVKEQILDQALELIAESGYKGFSMRKLSARLGIAAKTIYNYYVNKDEIYLVILTRGFESLYETCRTAARSRRDPLDRIAAMSRAFLDFGIHQPNLYNLMFTWHVPKFKDYLGTPMEPAAQVELETALKLSGLFIETVKACTDGSAPLSDEDARFLMIRFWTQGHGYVAGLNNTLLDYLHETPLSLKDRMVEAMMQNMKSELGKNAITKNTARSSV